MMKRIIDWIADLPVSTAQMVALFCFTVIARNLLEGFSTGIMFHWSAFALHFPIAYVFPMLSLVALMHLLSGYSLRRLLKLMVFAWTLTLLPPLIDFALSRQTTPIGYFPLDPANLGHFLLNFFNPAVSLPGTTAGIRIEAALGCLLAGLFVGVVSRRRALLRGVVTTLAFCLVFMVFFVWPYLVYALLSGGFQYTSNVQDFLQDRLVSHSHALGGVHFTVFLIDSIPVTLLGIWMTLSLYGRGLREGLRSGMRQSAAWLPVVLAGAVVGFRAGSQLLMTFADHVSVVGATLAAVLLALGLECRSKKPLGPGLVVWASLIALATGWQSLVVALILISVRLLPVPDRAARGLAVALSGLLP
ncbi:hypothetical protein JW921_11605, partial [Candidatus Fermentibacterales bacterium]|nr:hypothetical protein [Candidatus Fermentibacterales bacterium]